MPISARAKGMLNDAQQAGHPAPMDFSQLSMPVLLISAEDDRFGTAATARKIAAIVPQAELTWRYGRWIWPPTFVNRPKAASSTRIVAANIAPMITRNACRNMG